VVFPIRNPQSPIRNAWRLIWALSASLALTAAAQAGAKAPSAPPPKAPPAPKGLDRQRLAEELKKLIESKPLRGARVGVAAMDLSTGDWLFESNADESLIVASNNKLPTTAAALELLGPGFEFRTSVMAWGKLTGGSGPPGKRAGATLEGDLAIVGRGDPSISGRLQGQGARPTAVLEQWADAVAAAGIKAVRGGIIADDSYFDRIHLHPEWPTGQQAAWYCAPVSALSFNDNCVLLTVRPGAKSGDPAIATTDPPTAYVELANTCTTSRARVGNNRVLVHRRAGENRISISGDIRQQGAPFVSWVTVHEPALYCATVFREVLAAKGISVGGPVRLLAPPLRPPAEAVELAATTSTLKDAVEVANRNSQNFYAEQILKTLGREKAGRGTWPDGAAVVEKFLRQAGVKGAFSYRDGSGLARTDRFSTRQLVQLLSYANGRRWGSVFLNSLAQPGEGTLSRRMDALKGRLFAKTGYIAGVSALSGYVETQDKRLLAFAILVNDFRCGLADVRDFQDAFCLRLADYAP